MTIFQGSFGVSDRAEGSDDGEVGFGGIDSVLGEAWHSKGEGGRGVVWLVKGKVKSFNHLMWMAVGGSKGDYSKTKEVKKTW